MQKRRQRRRWAGLCGGLLLLAVWMVSPARAQTDARVTTHVSVDSVRIGERFTVTLVAEHPTDTRALFPDAEAGTGLFGDLHVVRRTPVQTRRRSGARRVDSVAYTVATFALDSARVPVLPVRLVAGDDTSVVGGGPRILPVESVVSADANGLRPPSLLAPFPRPFWVWAMLVLVGAALVAGGAYAWWRRQDPPEESEEDQEPRETPYEAASAQLQRLKRRNPTGHEACKAFYVDLTETIRVYLSRRVGIRALERTTSEVVAALRRRPEVQGITVRRLQGILEQADLVKFADAHPPPEESQAVLTDAQEVLDSIEATQRRVDAESSDETPTPA